MDSISFCSLLAIEQFINDPFEESIDLRKEQKDTHS